MASEITLTTQQTAVVNDPNNCVIIAGPGSGKTRTISCKIKELMKSFKPHRGLIAISYTNKASEQLKTRSLEDSAKGHASFFGSIHKFLLSEIIIPFGRHTFGKPEKEINVQPIKNNKDLKTEQIEYLNKYFPDYLTSTTLSQLQIEQVGKLYRKGVIFLEIVGPIAKYILSESISCRNYLKSRYSHIFIDEYQDSDTCQHEIFLEIVKMGVIGVAVGDMNQSIFKFDGRDSRFLNDLIHNIDFKKHYLTINHRSHQHIVEYSAKLLDNNFQITPQLERRVFGLRLKGDQLSIGKWLTENIPIIAKNYEVKKYSDIGILVKSGYSAEYLKKTLGLNYKFFVQTQIDLDFSSWANVFRSVLEFIFNESRYKYELVEQYLPFEISKQKIRYLVRSLRELVAHFESRNIVNQYVIKQLTQIAEIIYPNNYSPSSLDNLASVIENPNWIDNFKPADSDQIQLMTIHKSKGLEFDLVFHLDLYQYILPMSSSDPLQELNTHYVAITRAKKACYLITSTSRINSSGVSYSAIDSEYLSRNSLNLFREEL